jgi:hypothetical protein
MAELSELMALMDVGSGWISVGPFAVLWGRWLHRFWIEQDRFRPLGKPLLEQQGSGRTVEGAAAITVEPPLFPGGPGAGVLIDPS